MKKIIKFLILLVVCLMPLMGYADTKLNLEWKVNDRIYLYDENGIYYFINKELNYEDVESEKVYLYDKSGNYLREEILINFENTIPNQIEALKGKRFKAFTQIVNDNFISDSEKGIYANVDFDSRAFNYYDHELEYFVDKTFDDDIEFTKYCLGKYYDVYKLYEELDGYIYNIYKEGNYYFINYHSYEDDKFYVNVIDQNLNIILDVEVDYKSKYSGRVSDNYIYIMKNRRTIEMYGFDGDLEDSFIITHDDIGEEFEHSCGSYEVEYFFITNNYLLLNYQLLECESRMIDDFASMDTGKVGRTKTFNLKFKLDFEVEKVQSSNGDFSYIKDFDDNDKEYVKLDIKPDVGYSVDEIIVTDVNGNRIEVVDNKFYMPNSDVKIEVKYVYGEYLPIPDTGLGKSITIIFIGLILVGLGVYTMNYVRQE